jgi:hypothetical protein
MIYKVNSLERGMAEVVFVLCPSCQKRHSIVVRQDELEDYYARGSIGLAFPNMKAADRELFMTGMDEDCFKNATAEEF